MRKTPRRRVGGGMHPSRWFERPKELLGRISRRRVVREGRELVLVVGGRRGRRRREVGERRDGRMEVDLNVKELAEAVVFAVERERGVRTLDLNLSILWMA